MLHDECAVGCTLSQAQRPKVGCSATPFRGSRRLESMTPSPSEEIGLVVVRETLPARALCRRARVIPSALFAGMLRCITSVQRQRPRTKTMGRRVLQVSTRRDA